MSLSPARRTALRVLGRIRRDGAWARETLYADLARNPLPDAEAAYATRLVLGVAAMLGTLDQAIDRVVDRPRGLEPAVRDCLRMSAYELLFMGTPAHAVVDQGVSAVRRVRRQAAGLANAALRRLVTEADTFPWGDPNTDDEALARLTGHPLWLVDLFIDEHGRDAAERMLRSGDMPPPMYLAVNPFAAGDDDVLQELVGIGADPEPCSPMGCIHVREARIAAGSSILAEGRAIVADRAAQLAPMILAETVDGDLLDIAAGRGTKTLLLAAARQRMGSAASRILAVDSHAFKSETAVGRLRELGASGVSHATVDATDSDALRGVLDGAIPSGVLIDAPCSGLGTLRRHPEKRWTLRPDDIDGLARLGAMLLAASARLVPRGGVVVYSTCTVTERENGDVIRSFLSREGEGFRLVDLRDRVPQDLVRFVRPEGWFQSLPEAGGPDGHFVALIERV